MRTSSVAAGETLRSSREAFRTIRFYASQERLYINGTLSVAVWSGSALGEGSSALVKNDFVIVEGHSVPSRKYSMR